MLVRVAFNVPLIEMAIDSGRIESAVGGMTKGVRELKSAVPIAVVSSNRPPALDELSMGIRLVSPMNVATNEDCGL